MARLRTLLRSPGLTLAVLVLLGWLVIAVLWPLIAPYGPTAQTLTSRYAPPSAEHWLGTDNLGRDVLSRILAGSRSVLIVGIAATTLGVAIGTTLGLCAAFYRGRVDELLMRSLDLLMAFPIVVIASVILAMLGPSQLNLIVVIALMLAPYNARVVRSAVLSWRDRDFIAAARMRGESGAYILFRELLPNIVGTINVEFTMRLALSIFAVATLSFLGFGIQPPTPDWGLMVAEGRPFYQIAPWVVVAPAAAIASLVVAVNVLAQRLRAS
ncbi:MAG: ABC transporter permease [Actinomycetota bacterium]|jgi:peptide/nickel transport system permease protein|nr:ABC transporter permease [Actinomycetota bacterium]